LTGYKTLSELKCSQITYFDALGDRMKTPPEIVAQLTHSKRGFSKSELKVVDAILLDPESATRASIAHLAQLAGVSEPTINRFCKKLGASGFPDFKIKLALSLASDARFINSAVDADDDVGTFTPKIFDASVNALTRVRDSIDTKVIQRSIDQIVQSKQIYFFGLGNSGPVAADATFKFFRFNTPVSSHHDPLMQRMLAAASQSGDLFVMISHTGRTKSLLETTDIARRANATVIGITAPESPLAARCDLAITLDVPENTDEYLPMTSRLVQLTVLDVIATGVSLRQGQAHIPHLRRIKESLHDTRQPLDGAF
jgi:RpiR family transcriptional regulator, carbohydrate utilization regulator